MSQSDGKEKPDTDVCEFAVTANDHINVCRAVYFSTDQINVN